jgi:hypothetical protein
MRTAPDFDVCVEIKSPVADDDYFWNVTLVVWQKFSNANEERRCCLLTIQASGVHV